MSLTPLPVGFATAIMKMHVTADSAMSELVGISHRLYYCGHQTDPALIRSLVGDMREQVNRLDTSIAAVEATLAVQAPAAEPQPEPMQASA